MIDSKERQLLAQVRSAGPLSRWELHERTGLTPNRVGQLIDGLIRKKIVRERDPEPLRAGRPRVPIEVDPAGRHVLGLSITPKGLSACRMGLTGEMHDAVRVPDEIDPARLVQTAAAVVRKSIEPTTLGVAVTMTGLIDVAQRSLLLSSATPDQRKINLAPLDQSAGKLPLALGNVMQALAARWLLTQPQEVTEDVLLVSFDDGRVGSAYLTGGRPCRGVLAGANELGHTRLAVETERCFCGQKGCLEKVFSTGFLRLNDRSGATLAKRLAQFDPADARLQEMVAHFGIGLSNAVNFLRPHRLVLVSALSTHEQFRQAIGQQVREFLLAPLQDRVAIEFWNQPADQPAADAAWLGLAHLLQSGWDTAAPVELEHITA